MLGTVRPSINGWCWRARSTDRAWLRFARWCIGEIVSYRIQSVKEPEQTHVICWAEIKCWTVVHG